MEHYTAMVNRLLAQYGGLDARKEFWFFRNQQKGFYVAQSVAQSDPDSIWLIEDPLDFWNQAVSSPFLYILYDTKE
jgi:hypothetical protein